MLISDLRRTKELASIGQLFHDLGGKQKLKFKNEHWFMKNIRARNVSVIGNTIWVPSDNWLNENVIATAVLAYHWAYIYQNKMLPLVSIARLFSGKFRETLRVRAYFASLLVILYFSNGEYDKELDWYIPAISVVPTYRDVFSKPAEISIIFTMLPNAKKAWGMETYSRSRKREIDTNLGIILINTLKGLT